MTDHAEFLLRYGYLLLFGSVFIEQMGAPIPAAPILLAAGALAGLGRFSLGLVFALSTAATLLADLIWYELGRRKGMRVLQLLCRISLEPDSCIRRTEDTFARHGARSLLVAKFLPGLSTVAPPLAGVFQMRLARFLSFDSAGAALWIATFVGLGYAFSDQLEQIVAQSGRLGAGLLAVLLGALACWIGWKFIRRRRFIRTLRMDRIAPEELKRKLDAGEEVVVVDLRGSLDFEADPQTIPGALRVDASAIDELREQLARAPEVVLYCT
jgi:membrane protein DedA with SNARE-associated domain